MNIVKLHLIENNSTILFNCDFINVIDTDYYAENKRCALIYHDYNEYDIFHTNETPEKVFSLLENSMRLIKLHNANNNTVVYVNVDKIATICFANIEENNNSKIYMTGGNMEAFDVNESPEKIEHMINSLNKEIKK